MQPNPVSYRDQYSQVELLRDSVARYFHEDRAPEFEEFLGSNLYARLVAEDKIVPFEVTGRSGGTVRGTSPRLWSVSYPYEWSFSMLKDAALLTLELAEACLTEGFELRDASAFNVVFVAGRPRWVDLGSFGRRRSGIWEAYGQFLDHYLNPMAVATFSNMGVNPEWRGSLEGLPARLARKRTSIGFLLRNGLSRDIALRARIQAGAERKPTAKSSAQGVELPPAVLLKNISRVRRLIIGLHPTHHSHWESYDDQNTYEPELAQKKAEIVRSLASMAPKHRLAFDVGTNVGTYALELAKAYEKVVAVDADEAAIDVLYRRLQQPGGPSNVLPVVGDVLDPSPPRGLQLSERTPLIGRFGRPDLVSWLAVVHHLVLGRNVPLSLFFSLAHALGDTHLVEAPTEDDPMVDLLMARRSEPPWPYSVVDFERAASATFTIVEKTSVSSTRNAYLLQAR